MAEEPDDAVQRWTAKRRAALVVSILKGETSVAEAARRHGVTVAEVEDWLVLDNDILREALTPYPLARGTSDE